jgi:RecA/RadA recombinase
MEEKKKDGEGRDRRGNRKRVMIVVNRVLTEMGEAYITTDI